MTTLADRLTAWSQAELHGDVPALEALLHPDFLAVGPYGFLLDREQWLWRFAGGLNYIALTFVPDTDTRFVGGNAFVVGTQTQQGTHQGRPVDGAFRVTLVFTGEPDWRILAAHLSLRTPPDGPAPRPEPRPA